MPGVIFAEHNASRVWKVANEESMQIAAPAVANKWKKTANLTTRRDDCTQVFNYRIPNL
jgi:hypothetical protein